MSIRYLFSPCSPTKLGCAFLCYGCLPVLLQQSTRGQSTQSCCCLLWGAARLGVSHPVCSDEGPSFQGMYIFLHTVKGTPFETPDQGKARLLTHWEQMDYGVQFTASRKFLTITPIVL